MSYKFENGQIHICNPSLGMWW